GREVPEHRETDGPAERSDDVRRQEAAVRHPARAGENRGERADPRDPARDDDGPPAPPGEERVGALEVAPVEPAGLDPLLEPAAAEPAARGVADRVAGHGDGE